MSSSKSAQNVQDVAAYEGLSQADELHLYKSALENSPFGVSIFDKDEKLIFVNRHHREIYGYAPELAKPGTKMLHFFEYIDREEVTDRGMYQSGIERRLSNEPDEKFAVREWSLPDGRQIEVSRALMDDGGRIAFHEDVTAKRESISRILYLARHDALTDLLNRERFFEEFAFVLDEVSAKDPISLIAIDLDGFKNVNDSLGHAVGDRLLRAVSERLKECVDESCSIARLGGDEFAIFQQGASQPEGGLALSKAISKALAEPFDLDGVKPQIGASIGIATAPKDGTRPDQLMRNADLALYAAKKAGRNCERVFNPSMLSALNHRRSIERDLRYALEEGQLELHYQSIWDIKHECLCGFEALLRWNHPEMGFIPPDEFIPIAEDIGAIVEIGEWVLAQACRDAASWPANLWVAVNISPTQFKSQMLDRKVEEALSNSGLDPARLELEITEGVLLQESGEVTDILGRIRELGVSLSMDDFGTGYSSLGYLTRFPFDTMKIDGSFVRAMTSDANAHAVVRTIVALGDSLGIDIVAEGIETEEQYALARELGCDLIQGYLFARPTPNEDLGAIIEKSKLGDERKREAKDRPIIQRNKRRSVRR